MFSIGKQMFLEIATGIYVHQSTNANLKDSSWLLKEVGCVFLEKKLWGLELQFVKGKGSRFDIQVSFLNVKIKLWIKKTIKNLWKVDPENEFCAWSVLTKIKINLTE